MRNLYGHIVPDGEPIPAHLLGNMWSQSWVGLYKTIAPYQDEPSLDVTDQLKSKGVMGMFKMAEEFFVSIGWPKLPPSFWQKSMFERPLGREAKCHASAWDFGVVNNGSQDVRVKMCTQINTADFSTIHHELGHIYYYLLYWYQDNMFRTGANPGFHEAVGDLMSLSVQTPNHLHQVGLLDEVVNNEKADINFLLQMAMKKIAFLPFGYLMDKWTWSVYDGSTTPAEYNTKWWELRTKYQGIKAPVSRNDALDFDPGAKNHIGGNTPYIRYFFSHILQFTFHKHACKEAGHVGPLHKCSIYKSKKAGKRLGDMLALGRSEKWQVALKNLTGSEILTADPVNEYFNDLKVWLKKQRDLEGYCIGWDDTKKCPEKPEKESSDSIFTVNIFLMLSSITLYLYYIVTLV